MEEAIQLLKDIRDLLQRAENREQFRLIPPPWTQPPPWTPYEAPPWYRRAPWETGPTCGTTKDGPPDPNIRVYNTGAAP